MSEGVPAAPGIHYCPQCGARLPAAARFCPGCGRAMGALLRATETTGPTPVRALREQLPGLAVLTLFLAVGLTLWFGVLRPGAPTSRAPTRSVGPAGAGTMPPDHPPLALDDEAKKLVATLVAKAEAAPNDVAAWRNLAQVQVRAAGIDPTYAAQAVESYRRVLVLEPDDTDAIRALGNLYYDQRQFPAAAEEYERYLKARPDDASVRTDLATTYLYQQQTDRAIDTYASVIAANPNSLQAHFNMALAYQAKGERTKALDALAKARSLAGDDATRAQIDRVKAQLMGGAGGEAAADAATSGFRGTVEAELRAHEIIGSRITAIEWLEPFRARVRMADFPIEAMPEFARGLLRARLETILEDGKTKHGLTDTSEIELVDAGSGASIERARR